MNKISSLGKIILFLFIPILSFANVSATLDKVAVIKGDNATLTIRATGSNIEFPKLRDLEGHPIVGTSTSTSITIVNGSMKKTKIIKYTFTPKYTFIVPNYSIIINGKEEQTEPIKIKVLEPTASSPNDILQLELKLNKKTAYVGEALKASVIFKYKVGSNLVDVNLEEFKINHFWIKTLNSSKPYEKNGYILLKQDYLIFPQLAGNYTIDKQLINVASREYGTNMIRWKKIFSKEVQVNIKALPQGLSIQGDYKITASVDAQSTKANKPVNLTIRIKGNGNIDDIEEFKLELEDEVVYSTKPTVKTFIQGGKYGGEFTQKLSIIADKDFTIPSIKFKYFDIRTKSVKTIKTKPFNIKVKGKAKITPNIQTNKNTAQVKTVQLPAKIIYKSEDSYIKYIFAIIGFILGIVATFLLLKKKVKKEDLRDLSIKIKKAKNDKELYNILLAYSYNIKIVSQIKLLEQNIYNNKNNPISKETLYDIVEEFDLK